MSLRVAVRVDASARIGYGHVMRCLALAEALRANDAEVFFLCRHLPEHLESRIRGLGAHCMRLPPRPPVAGLVGYAQWLEVTQQDDAQDSLNALSRCGTLDWLVVDHYALDVQWQRRLRPAAARLMVVDDLDDRTHDCDMLLDHNYTCRADTAYLQHVDCGCVRLLGARFALIRNEFLRARESSLRVRQTLQRVLISFGGGDAGNQTAKALQALSAPALQALSVDVVIAAAHPQREQIHALAKQRGNAVVHEDSMQMAELAQRADLALGAAGVSIWERSCTGLPSVVLVLVDNQRSSAQALSEDGLVLLLGEAAEVDIESISSVLMGLQACPGWLRQLSLRVQDLCDGHGAARVVARMRGMLLRARLATETDSESLWQWRNDERNRQYALDNRPIAWETHLAWFGKCLADPLRTLLIVEDDSGAVGVVRYDIAAPDARVSIYLVPERHGAGLGGSVLRAAEIWLRAHRPQVKHLTAEVLTDNAASLKIFAEAGYSHYCHVLGKLLNADEGGNP